MTNKELKGYLDLFHDDAEVVCIIANPKRRKVYEIENDFGITDMGQHIFCIEVGNEKPMDEEMIKACEEDEKADKNLPGQMEITDFIEATNYYTERFNRVM